MLFTTNCRFGSATTIGVVLTTLGAVFVVYWPVMFDTVLNEELVLSEHSKSFDLWEVTPIPMYIEFYFFNWTNPNEIRDHTKRPILEELGPYVFKEHRRKVIKNWFPENSTVTFLQNRTWQFQPKLSSGSLDDLIVTVNIPAITAAFSVRKSSSFEKHMLNYAMRLLGTKLWVKKKVREFLFDGYRDPLLDLASIIPAEYVPVTIPFDKFGWFYTRNGSATYDGLFNMYTGKEDIKRFGEVGEWNNVNSTSYYESFCGNVNGSAGEFFPPKRTKTHISLFSPDVCRTLTLTYKEEIVVDGISGYRYWGDDSMLQNATTDADNWCFCPSGECAPNGAIDVSTCKWGAPAFISFPHFYHADPWYREAVIGMKPEMEKHQMFIDLEPNSGIPLQVSAALQINILMQPMKEISLLDGLPKIYFPAIWFKQTAKIDDVIGPEVKWLSVIPSLGSIIFYCMLSIGLSTLLVVGICYTTMRCRKDEDTVILKASFRMQELKMKFLDILRMLSSKFQRVNKVQPESILTIHKSYAEVPEETYCIPKCSPVDLENTSLTISPLMSETGLVVDNKCIRRHSQISFMHEVDEECLPLYDDIIC